MAVSVHLLLFSLFFIVILQSMQRQVRTNDSEYRVELIVSPPPNRPQPKPTRSIQRTAELPDIGSGDTRRQPAIRKKPSYIKGRPEATAESEPELRDVPQAQMVAPDLPAKEEDIAVEPDLSAIRLEPSVSLLNEIATADPRVKRRLDAMKRGPFETPQVPSLVNLPKSLKYDEIRRKMSVQWTPDWDDIKSEGISEVSGEWVKRGLSNWLKRWQESIKKHDNNGSPAREKKPYELEPTDIESTSNEVAVDLALEPLRDGTWAVSISNASGHPFFDRETLAQVRAVAALFPPWPEGYGSALIYRMKAKFIIVPPSASTLIGLTCAFPFCTPEELKKAEVIHWFKKMIRKNVRFLGLVR